MFGGAPFGNYPFGNPTKPAGQSLALAGWDTGCVGSASIAGRGVVSATGWDAHGVGVASVISSATVAGAGWDSQCVGTATLSKVLALVGFDAAVMGSASVGRPLAPAGWDASAFGESKASGSAQVVEVSSGYDFTGLGLPSISNKNRWMAVPGINTTKFMEPGVANKNRVASPAGFSALRGVSAGAVSNAASVVSPQSIGPVDVSVFGMVRNGHEFVRPRPWISLAVGDARIARWGVRAAGFHSMAFGRAVLGFARVVPMVGFESAQMGTSTAQNAKFTRRTTPVEWDSAGMGMDAEIRNAQQFIARTRVADYWTASASQTLWGAAWVHNRNRRVSVQGIDSLMPWRGSLGGFFAGVTVENRNRKLPLPMAGCGGPSDGARIENLNRSLQMAGVDCFDMGYPNVEGWIRTVGVDGIDSLEPPDRYHRIWLHSIFPFAINPYTAQWQSFKNIHVTHWVQTVPMPTVQPLSFGTASLALQYRRVNAAGFSAGGVGSARVEFKNRTRRVGGLQSVAFGPSTKVETYHRPVVAGVGAVGSVGSAAIGWVVRGILSTSAGDRLRLGTVYIAHPQRLPMAGWSHLAFGRPLVQGDLLSILPRGRDSAVMGSACVEGGIRAVDVLAFEAGAIGQPVMGRHQLAAVTGTDGSVFGVASLRDNTQAQPLGGWAAVEFGVPLLGRNPAFVAPRGIMDAAEDMPSSVSNVLQVIQQYRGLYDDGLWINPRIWVRNRNTRAQMDGFDSSRWARGWPLLEHGPVVAPSGVSYEAFGDGAIGYAVRGLPFDGFDSACVMQAGHVRNAAFAPTPQAWDSAAFGTAKAFDPARTIRHAGQIEPGMPGGAWISFRVRELPVGRYEKASGLVGDAWVSRSPRSLAVGGVEYTVFGRADAVSRLNRVKSRRWESNVVSADARVRNVTPEIVAKPCHDGGVGLPTVRFSTQFVAPSWATASLFGAVGVRDRTRKVKAGPFSVPAISLRHRLAYAFEPNVPFRQSVAPSGFGVAGMGGVSVGINGVWPDGLLAVTFGRTAVSMMGASPPGIYLAYDDAWGWPVVDLKNRAVRPPSVTSLELGALRVDPHVISCDALPELGGVGAHHVFGGGGVVAQGFAAWGIGTASVDWRVRRVRPPGKRSLRFGWAMLSPRRVLPVGADMAAISGEVVVAHAEPATNTVSVQVVAGGAFGLARVEGWVRHIGCGGISSLAGLLPRIHYPEPAMPLGWVSEWFGEAWVSNWIRHVHSEGWDSQDFTPELLATRLRVKRGQPLMVDSIVPCAFGLATVTQKTRWLSAQEFGGAAFGRAKLEPRVRRIKAFPPSTMGKIMGRPTITRG